MLIVRVRLIGQVAATASVGDPVVSIEYPGEVQMFGQRSSHLDPARTGDEGRRRPERVRGASPRHRRRRPGVECLEDRRLLSAITEFPLPTSDGPPAGLTVGPDGNLWFPGNASAETVIGRITPAGALAAFPLPAGVYYNSDSLTVGPDGNLWFAESPAAGPAIARITPAGALTEFPTGGAPGPLAVGPDGNLWFAEGSLDANSPGAIGRITPAGALTEFPLPAGLDSPFAVDLTVSPDGNLWFLVEDPTSQDTSEAIGRITPSGALAEFPLPAGYLLQSQSGLTVGPDGNLWFIEYGAAGSAIGRITPAGAIIQFPTDYRPNALTVGPDGNLWFPENSYKSAGSAIGRVTPAGAITQFPLPTPNGAPGPIEPGQLTVGPDGDLWFTEYFQTFWVGIPPPPSSSEIARITPAGALTEFPTGGSPGPLTVGPDGNLWFIEVAGYSLKETDDLGRVTPAGALTEFPLPAGNADPGNLTVGPDGNLWFTEISSAGSAIGRIDPFDPTGPRVTSVVAAAHRRKAIASILVGFDEALDPASATEVRFYSVAPGVKRRHKLVFRKGVKIGRVSYDATAQTIRLKLAVPQKGPIQVTVRAGIVAADGTSSASDFTAVVP
jgi:streptogramin lyase